MGKNQDDRESKDMRGPTEEEILGEVLEYQKYLLGNLPKSVNREEVSTISKSALKAHIIRASLLHRADELTKTALDLYQQKKLVSGLVIVRAAFETAALLYYVCKKLREAVETKKVDNIDETLMQVMFGDRRNGTGIKAFSILTVIDHLDKENRIDGEGFLRSIYEDLCEYAHPNWSGTMGSYARESIEQFSMTFDQEPKELKPWCMLVPLEIALMIIAEYDNEMQKILPNFTKLHEEARKEQD